MAKKLVILDADAIIELHQLKKWGHALSSWTPVVPESVYRQEAVYVSREFTKEHLTLGEDRDKGHIRVTSAGIPSACSLVPQAPSRKTTLSASSSLSRYAWPVNSVPPFDSPDTMAEEKDTQMYLAYIPFG